MRNLYTLFLLTATLSQAATVTYNSLASWESAGGGSQNTLGTVMFNSFQSGDDSFYLTGFTFRTVTNSNGMIQYQSPQAFGSLWEGTFLGVQPGSLTITIPSGIYGLSFLIGSNNLNGNVANPVTVTVNNGTSTSVATTPTLSNPATFWGVRSDAPITTIQINALAGNYIFLDSLRWQNTPYVAAPPPTAPDPPTETPEAATAILIGFSLLSLPALKRRFGISSSDPHRLAH
jgi:hypothetical protein